MTQAQQEKPMFVATIPGRPIVKKNTQRVVGSGRARRAIYTKRYVSWSSDAMANLARALKSKPQILSNVSLIDFPVSAHFKFYFANRQGEADVSNLLEGPQDVLVKAGILKDDRLIVKVIGEKFFGHTPRTEISIFKYLEAA